MRILAIADIHGEIKVYEWLRNAVSDYGADVLILAGDLLTGGWEAEQSEQARTISRTAGLGEFFKYIT